MTLVRNKLRMLVAAALLLTIVTIAACGGSAPAEPVATSAPSAPQATKAPVAAATVAPAATAVPKESPSESTKPAGAINYGIKESGIFEGHPRFISSPGSSIQP